MEFGPCKHGKFADTEYQETFVYDIVSHSDARRHPVMVDDNVLAPWEPEGERYAPAVIISGLEKRMADGSRAFIIVELTWTELLFASTNHPIIATANQCEV